MTIASTTNSQAANRWVTNGFRYPDHQPERVLRGCRTGVEWWSHHPVLPVQVSNLGRVRGVRGWVLKPYLHDGRYPALDLCGYRHYRVHHLVLEAWIGPRPPGQEARHFDGVKTNVKLDNLGWGTRSDNQRDRRRHEAETLNRLGFPRFAQQRRDINRKLAVLDRLEQMAAG